MQSGGSQADERLAGEQMEVVIDQEGRHALWPQGRTLPVGWALAGVCGDRTACLDHIGQVWRDQRPRSLQEARHDPH